jgi:formate dehydrogenase maturation protein FdhE
MKMSFDNWKDSWYMKHPAQYPVIDADLADAGYLCDTCGGLPKYGVISLGKQTEKTYVICTVCGSVVKGGPVKSSRCALNLYKLKCDYYRK